MGNRTLNILYALLLIATLSTVGSIIYHFSDKQYKTDTATASVVSDSVTCNAVFIRDEKVLKKSKQGVISYNVTDAAKLGIGSTVAQVFASEDDADRQAEINNLTEKATVLSKVQNPGTSLSAQPENIADRINDVYNTFISLRSKGNISGAANTDSDFATLFSTYQVLTDDKTDFSDVISSINSQIEKLQGEQSEPLETVKSDASSYFIGYADGYEDKISTSLIPHGITPKFIDSVSDKGALNDDNIVGKLVTSYKWYAAGVVDTDDVSRYNVGDSVKIRFTSSDSAADGIIEQLIDNGNDTDTIIVSSTEYEPEFVSHRKETIQIEHGTYTGIKVPRSVLRFKTINVDATETQDNGIKTKVTEAATNDNGEHEVETETKQNAAGVYVLDGEEVKFKQIQTIFETDDYVVCALTDDDNYLNLYDSIITEGADING